MKKVLLASSALAAMAGIASAQGGLTVSGTASMGALGGGWIVDRGLAQVEERPRRRRGRRGRRGRFHTKRERASKFTPPAPE